MTIILSEKERERARKQAVSMIEKANIYLKEEEKANLEIASMGLGMLDKIGIQIHTYINTKRCSAKELVLFPGQICPEQIHPPVEGGPGKEESFRVRWGVLYLYVEGEPTKNIKAKIPSGKEDTFTVYHEIVLNKGDQYTLEPGIKHWLCGGPEGCVVSEFATYNRDDLDIFTDPEVDRTSQI
jgi:D-lyxose ketol-isomerase